MLISSVNTNMSILRGFTFRRFESLLAKTMLSGFRSRWTIWLMAKKSQPQQIWSGKQMHWSRYQWGDRYTNDLNVYPIFSFGDKIRAGKAVFSRKGQINFTAKVIWLMQLRMTTFYLNIRSPKCAHKLTIILCHAGEKDTKKKVQTKNNIRP